MARAGHQVSSPRRAAWATAAARDDTLSLLRMLATHGVIAEKEPLGNRLVAQAVGDQPKHLDLAPGEARLRLRGRLRTGSG